MPSLSSEQFSSSTGKRGRRGSAPDPDATSIGISAPDRDPRDLSSDEAKAASYVPPNPTLATGSPCPRCARPSERNGSILRAYGLMVDKCTPCATVWIEGDGGYVYDVKTAAAGLLLRRAGIVWDVKHPTMPEPAIKGGIGEALMSDWDDVRWEGE